MSSSESNGKLAEHEEGLETIAVRTKTPASANREHATPIYMTSSFTFDSAEQARALFAREIEGNVYSRYSNPNVDEFVQKMCLLEGAEEGVAVASGMSALFTALAGLLQSGDHVLACRSVFGSTHQILTKILPRWGITHSYGEILEPDTWHDLVQPNTKLCVVETPSNPGLDLIDLKWLGRFCAEHQLTLIVDNVFATPILQRPIEYGAHLVMHSATKYIDGQGRGLGGVLVGDKDVVDVLRTFARHSGPSLSPFNAWMFSKSLETLKLRVEQHSANALELAQFLESHPQVEFVKYPHLPSHPQYDLALRMMRKGGGVVTFGVKGGLEQGRRFLDALDMLSHTANLGDSRTIATHPASTTHSSLTEEDRQAVGILPGLIRISAGLESIDDIIADVDQALNRSA
ncbi:MAG TPA: aminotransferase class I/II-fold pyridoxal phosphate-dependent enzyme [Rhodothermales bacterium]|nr:aminotransferase class I/II-fold pyridoxal phosphate-dependent enzyme [Rhodothermales bacterium]